MIAGAMPGGALGASAASNMSSQARADAKREAKEARDREREKRQTWKQYEQSRRESVYAQHIPCIPEEGQYNHIPCIQEEGIYWQAFMRATAISRISTAGLLTSISHYFINL